MINSLMPLSSTAPGRLSSPVLSRSGHSNGVASLGTPARPGPSKQAHAKGKAIGPFPTSKASQKKKKSTFQCPVSSLAHPLAQSVWYFAILGRLPGTGNMYVLCLVRGLVNLSPTAFLSYFLFQILLYKQYCVLHNYIHDLLCLSAMRFPSG